MNKPYIDTLWTSSVVVEEHKATYRAWVETDMQKECDPLWLPHMATLNIHDSLVTQYCCSGHPNDGDDQLYLLFIVDSNGWAILQQVFARFVLEMGLEATYDHRITLRYYISNRESAYLPRWLFEARVQSIEDQTLIIDTFMRVYKEIVCQHLPYFHPERTG